MTNQERKDFFGKLLSSYEGELNEKHEGLSYVGTHLTHIDIICENVASGYYLGHSGRALPFFAIKEDNNIGMGCSYGQAADSLLGKQIRGTPLRQRIEKFVSEHKKDEAYTIAHFWKWHRILTCSCYGGGERFKELHNLKDDDLLTVQEFIKLTENDVGGDIIKDLKRYYPEEVQE